MYLRDILEEVKGDWKLAVAATIPGKAIAYKEGRIPDADELRGGRKKALEVDRQVRRIGDSLEARGLGHLFWIDTAIREQWRNDWRQPAYSLPFKNATVLQGIYFLPAAGALPPSSPAGPAGMPGHPPRPLWPGPPIMGPCPPIMWPWRPIMGQPIPSSIMPPIMPP